MKFKTWAPFLAWLAVVALSLPAAAGTHSRHGGITTTTHDDTDSTDCSERYHVRFNDFETYRSEEERTFQKSDFPNGLQLEASRNGGIDVIGWERNDILIKACKVAAGESEAEAGSRLDEVRLQVQGGRVSATGPAIEGLWVAHILAFVPKGMKLEVGPPTVRSRCASFRAR